MKNFFKLEEKGTNIRTELIAGATTFLSMAYILAVNPDLLSKAGLSMGAVFTATAISAGVASIFMGLVANLPIALAPGMGLNAFFTFTVVLGMNYSPAVALTAVFLEGLVFMVLSFFNVREAVIDSIPGNLKKATAVGIGVFITLIGMKNAGIVVANPATLVSFGDLNSGTALLAIIGLIITASLYTLKVPGSILLGIIITTIIGIPMDITAPMGGWKGWLPVSLPAAPTLLNFDFGSVLSFKFFIVFFSFFFVDLFDTVGTLVGVTTQAGLIDKDGKIPRVKQALLADAVGTSLGAMLGTSTVTSYIESSSGVAVGGRTGLTSITSGILFFVALFLSPFFLLVPGAATAPALIIVGALMMQAVVDIDFKDPTEAIPAFLTIVIMPFSYSIAEGIVFGVLSYVILKAITLKFKQISIVTWILFFIFLARFILKDLLV